MPTTVAEAKQRPAPITAEEAYRRAVFAAGKRGTPLAEEIAFAAGRTLADMEKHAARYRRRVAEAAVLKRRVPELQRLADEAKRRAERAAAIGSRPVDDFPTVAALFEALSAHGQQSQPGYISPERRAAAEATGAVAAARQPAVEYLRATADAEIARQISAQLQEQNAVESRMSGRREVLEVDARIARQREKVDRLSRGESPLAVLGGAQYGFRPEDVERIERARLDTLVQLQKEKPQAQADDAADGRRLREITWQIAALESSRLVPENMDWR